MKICLVNDQHFGNRSDSNLLLDHQQKFYDEVFFPYVDEHKIKTIVDLGDTFDRRKFINFNTLDRAKQMWFEPIAKRGLRLHVLAGNHSVYYRNTNVLNSPKLLLTEYPEIFVLWGPCMNIMDDLKVLMLPWITVDNYDECMAAIKRTPAKVCFAHLELAGFEMDAGNMMHEGMDRGIFNKFDKVISGHYHHKSDDGKIFYCGTQYEMAWSDYDDPKGFHVFDTGSLELDFIRNPHRLFYKIWYDDTDGGGSLKDFTEYKDKFVKLIVSNKNDTMKFDRFVTALQAANPADLQIVEDFGALGETDFVMDQADSTPVAINKYIDATEYTDDVDTNHLKRLMNELYVESLHVGSDK